LGWACKNGIYWILESGLTHDESELEKICQLDEVELHDLCVQLEVDHHRRQVE